MYRFQALPSAADLPKKRSKLMLPDTDKMSKYIDQGRYGEYMAEFRGSLLTLYGDPLTTQGDTEYRYIVEAIESNEQDTSPTRWLFIIAQGASGPYIGGDTRDRSAYPVAQTLWALIESTPPSDFEAAVKNIDTNKKVIYGCRDGIGYWTESS
jgi:hypothetical protein